MFPGSGGRLRRESGLKRGDVLFLGLATTALAAVIVWRTLGSGVPSNVPVPAMFQEGTGSLSLDEALRQSEATGRPVFAVVSAGWCPPCRVYKAGALVDADVEAWVEQNAIPVYIDADHDAHDASRLRTQYLPTTYVIRGGEIVAARSGNLGAGELMTWLREAAGDWRTVP